MNRATNRVKFSGIDFKRSIIFRSILVVLIAAVIYAAAPIAFANTPTAGGDATVVNPVGGGAVSISEDAPTPEAANIRLVVPTLIDSGGGTPSSIRIIAVTGGSISQGATGSSITLGASGTILGLTSGRIDLRFVPVANRDSAATFQYVVVDPHNSSVNSAESTATVNITPVNDPPILQTSSGENGDGLYGTYYLNDWQLTGTTANKVDPTINFISLAEFPIPTTVWGMPNMNPEQYSIRWTGQVKAPVSGTFYFSTVTDDGTRLWINDNLVIDSWIPQAATFYESIGISMTAGTKYNIKFEYYERGGGEQATLQWRYPGQGVQVIPQAYLFPGTSRATLSYVTSSGAVPIDDGIIISDIDSANMASATVSIASNYISGEDYLGFNPQNGISGSFNGTTGVLTLSGASSRANYQTALQSVTYTNTSATPNTSTRTISFLVNDGAIDSNATTRNITITATNNAPVITQGASSSVTMSEDASPTAFSLTLGATDTENNTLTWSVSGAASHGSASVSGTGNSKAISYTPVANYNGTDSFLVQVSDGLGGIDTITINVTISAVNDLPIITEGATISKTIDEDSSPTAFTQTLNATDIDGNTLTWSISTPASHGAAAISGTGASKSLSYEPTTNYNGTDSFVVTVSDGNSGTDTITINVTISPRNDPPKVTVLPVITQPVEPTRVDHTLGVTSGTWNDGDDLVPGTIGYTYQWQRCTTTECTDATDIADATLSTYTVGATEQSKFLRVKVVATDNGEGLPTSQSVTVYTSALGQILAADSSLTIQENKSYTNSNAVSLAILTRSILTGVTEMSLSESPLFTGATWVPYALTGQYNLSAGDGQKTIYIRFRDAAGNISTSYFNTIILDTSAALQVEKVGQTALETISRQITINSVQPVISGTAEPGSVINIVVHSDPIIGQTTADSSGRWSWTPLITIPLGTHQVLVTTTDLAGNSKEVSFSMIVEGALAANTTPVRNSTVSPNASSATVESAAAQVTDISTVASGKSNTVTEETTKKANPWWLWIILVFILIYLYYEYRRRKI